MTERKKRQGKRARWRHRIPERTCVVCRKKCERTQLVRIACYDNKVQWDEKNVLPGRGAYVCLEKECIAKAISNNKNCLGRAFKKDISTVKNILKSTTPQTNED